MATMTSRNPYARAIETLAILLGGASAGAAEAAKYPVWWAPRLQLSTLRDIDEGCGSGMENLVDKI